MDEGKAEPGNVEDMPQVSGTPAIPLRRKSMKSARKTPKSAMTSALNVMRSRRSGASRANLKGKFTSIMFLKKIILKKKQVFSFGCASLF